MKKKIAIVSNKMILGGIERCMLSMLSEIDNDKYDITLFLEERGGDLEKEIPKWIKVKYLFDDYKSIKENMIDSLKRFKVINVFKFLYLGVKICTLKNGYYLYKDKCNLLSKQDEVYDLAISYHNPVNLSTIYVIDKIKAKNKVMWIHTDVKTFIREIDYLREYYHKYDKIFAVSPAIAKSFGEKYPSLKYKIDVFYNRVVKSEIINKVDNKNHYKNIDEIKLLTVGRICYEKAIDLIPEVCKKLKSEGYKFKWYCIGWGEIEKIKDLIKKYDVNDCFELLGSKNNPYNYIKDCDIYVQPSRYEGYVTTVTEAKCFNRPIVATNIDGIKEQLINNETGILVKCDADSLYNGIKILLDDKRLREKLSINLSNENIDTRNEMNKLYELMK